MTFDVLFVCTGNICRSPMAERLFLSRAAAHAPVRAGSAGTRALVGYGMDLPSAAVLRELGGDPTGHVARRLTPGMAEAAHLVLTADTDHRAGVLQLAPLALRRTFTVREYTRLAAGLPPLAGEPGVDDLVRRVAEVAARRGFVPSAPPGQDDVGDPFGAPMDVVRRTGRQLSDAVDAILTDLALGRAHAR